MRQIRILHIINSLDIGGNERFLLQLLQYLPRDKFHQEVCVPDRGKDATRDLETECRKLGIPIRIFRVRGNLDVRVLFKLRRLIVGGHYDIVHTHLIYSQIYGRLAAASARAKIVVSSEQNVYELKAHFPFRWIERRLTGLTDRVIVCSNRVREHLVHRVGINPLKVVVAPNAVDTKLFSPIQKTSRLFENVRAVRRELGIEDGDVVIGTVGHMSRQKGHKFLIAAIPRVQLRYPRARFVFVGRGQLRDALRTQARSLGVEEAVRFTGIRQDVSVLLNCFDMFVLPSLWEGFGIAIIEAMACGAPVVASAVGGIPEIIEDGADGFLVPPGRSRPLAQSIIKLLDNPSLRSDMIYRGLRKAVRQFNVTRMTETVAKVYSQMFDRTELPKQELGSSGGARVSVISTALERDSARSASSPRTGTPPRS